MKQGSLLASFNLSSTVKFPTRICNNSSTLIDNIYINTNSLNFSVHPVTNGLSDHDAQVINLFNILSAAPSYPLSFSRKINRNSICKFTDLLSYESWDDVFLENNVNIICNNFQNSYLRIFNACFPTIKPHVSIKPKPWLTTGIRMSCANKRMLYTGCPRRNVKYFGRVFLMLNYADITQNTYIQS